MATRVLSPPGALLTILLTGALLEPDAVKVARPVRRIVSNAPGGDRTRVAIQGSQPR